MFQSSLLTPQQKNNQKGNTSPAFFFQPKLTINDPNDVYEREADATADRVMRMTATAEEHSFFTPHTILAVQRKCKECEEEDKMHRKEANGETTAADASTESYIDSLDGKGKSLTQNERSFFEPRFGYDFSQVQLHTDDQANQSAKSVNALAYTQENNIVFGAGQYQPNSESGKRLLAHELTHVIQQKGNDGKFQRKSDPAIFRTVSSFTQCPDNTNGSPTSALDEQKAADAKAKEIATNASNLTGASPVDAATLQTYTKRFGTPPAVGSGFMNRLSGAVVKTLDDAQNGELKILSHRYKIVANMFSQPVTYRCIGGKSSFGGCEPPHCNDVFAWSCRGVGAIFMCPDYWSKTANADQRGAVLVHEAFHINFGVSGKRQIGEVGDENLKGSGKNFLIADCYGGFAADLAGVVNPDDTCPAP